MNDNCHICVGNKDLEANLLTTDYWHVILSPDQGYLGRAYVTLRDHKGTLGDLTDAEWQDYVSIVRRLENACKVGLGATLSNWTCLMNNAYQQKPNLPHVHWHFRPRYAEPVIINGVTFGDPDYGFHYDREQKQSVDDETFQIIIVKIKANL
jgi:diadenosine tetraphosphate (Ap4A) HIT family hydrolase